MFFNKTTKKIVAGIALFAGAVSFTHAASSVDLNPTVNTLNLSKLSEAGRIKSNQLIVKFKTPTENLMQNVLSQFGVDKIKKFYQPIYKTNPFTEQLKQWRVVSFNKGTNLQSIFDALSKNSNVEWVAPNNLYTASALPNDLHSNLWGLNNTGQQVLLGVDYQGNEIFDSGIADADVDAPEAWDAEPNLSTVNVAIIDTGIDYTHPDLVNNLWTNPNEIPNNGLDDDNNGLVDDYYGYDFVNNDGDPMDGHGHGTHIAGTIAGVRNNGEGVVGLAPNAKVAGIKVLSDNGGGYTTDIVNGIMYAIDMGFPVSNNSWGSGYSNAVVLNIFDRPMKEALQVTHEANHLFVAAAGNNGDNFDVQGPYAQSVPVNSPSGFEFPNIISVAASDYNDERASFSNYGTVEVDLAAPGVAIYSTLPGNTYAAWNGTSMASPHVAAAAAMLLGKNPTLLPYEIRALLMQSVDQPVGLQGITVSSGRLNVATALEALDAQACASYTSTLSAHVTAGRAYTQSSGFWWVTTTTYYATGSAENLGTSSTATKTLVENSPGSFSTSTTCNGGLDLPPALELNGEAEIYMMIGSSYSDAGATAKDREDGNLTSSIQTTNNVNTNTAGVYTVEYNVTDSHGNAAVKLQRVIIVVDEDLAPNIMLFGPHFTGFGGAIGVSEVNTPYVDPGYIAWDILDGELTDQVTSTGRIVNTTPTEVGVYRIDYDVVDSNGNHWPSAGYIHREVAIVPPVNPLLAVITSDEFADGRWSTDSSYEYSTYERFPCELTGEDAQYCEKFTVPAYGFDLQDGQMPEEHLVRSGGDLFNAGTYDFDISATDTDGNTTSVSVRLNVIKDVTPPVLTLNGDAEITLLRTQKDGVFYSDPGYTCVDDLAENCTGTVWWDEGVNPKVANTYYRYFEFEDRVGNKAPMLTRTIHVVPGTAPTLSSLNSAYNGSTLTVTGNVADVDSDLREVRIVHNGAIYLCDGTSAISCTANISSGSAFSVDVVAEDWSGNVTTQTLQIETAANCVTATNYNHVAQGRAHKVTQYYIVYAYANGSNDNLGQYGSTYYSATTSLQETSANHWVKVTSCP